MQSIFYKFARLRLNLPLEIVKHIEDYCYVTTTLGTKRNINKRGRWHVLAKVWLLNPGDINLCYQRHRCFGPAVISNYCYDLGRRILSESMCEKKIFYYNGYRYRTEHEYFHSKKISGRDHVASTKYSYKRLRIK